jgi:hypothetical protein
MKHACRQNDFFLRRQHVRSVVGRDDDSSRNLAFVEQDLAGLRA